MARVEFRVRPYRPEDAAALSGVMWRSVREAALADYSVEQTAAWLPEPLGPEAMGRWATDGRHVVVAVNDDDEVVGYVDLESSGHIDHLFCVPEAVGQGVAGALYAALEDVAADLGIRELRVEASEAARRFFEKSGFVVVCRRELDLQGVAIHNYAMVKSLRPSAAEGEC